MRSSSTRRRRIARSRIARGRARGRARPQPRDNAAMRDSLRATPCSRSATCSSPPRRSSLLAIGLLVLAYWLLDPTPPKQVVLATGPDQGAYAEFGKRYAQILKAQRHRGASCGRPPARPRTSPCCASRTASVDIAFVQGGADASAARSARRRRRRRPGLARQPVLRAGLAVLSRRLGRAAAEGARARRACRSSPAGASTSARPAAACPT